MPLRRRRIAARDLDHQVRQRRRAAHQRAALRAQPIRQRAALVGAMVHAALQHMAQAHATAAVAALVGQRQALAQASLQQGFAGPHRQRPGTTVGAMDFEHERARGLAPTARRPPGQQHQQRARHAHQRPHLAHRPGVEQRQQGEVEPVEAQPADRHRHVGRAALAERRRHQRQQQQRRQQAEHDRARRVGARLGHALHMHPHQQQHQQRNADVHERQQREEAVVHAARVDEVAHQRAAEARQPVEPFETGGDHELAQLVPGQHVAVDARRVHQPHQHHAGEPREPAESAQAVEREHAQHVQQHRQHQGVGGVAVQAAQDASGPPLPVRDRLDRRVRTRHPGLEERVQVQPARRDDPEQEEADRPELVQRVQPVAKSRVEQRLHAHEQPLQATLQGPRDHAGKTRATGRSSDRATTSTNSSPPTMATRPPRPISPMPAISAVLRSTCSAPATLRCTP